MSTDSSNALVQSAIRIGAAGLGAAVAGPLGGVFGGFVADAFGKSTAEFLKKGFSSFGEEAAKKLLDTGTDSLTDRLSKPAPDLEALYRESLRESLAALRPSSTAVVPAADSISSTYIDWFDHWNLSLQSGVPLQLEPLRPGDLTPASLDGLFAGTLERLDAQGAAIASKSTSILLQTRPIPPELLTVLQSRLPGKFHDSFSSLLVTEKYQQAWNQAELAFRGWLQDTLARIDARTENIDRKTDLLPGMSEKLDQLTRMLAGQQAVNEDFSRRLGQSLNRDKSDGVAGGLNVAQLVEESKRQAALIEQLQKQLAARASEPGDVEFARLLRDQDYDAALKLKSSQVEARAAEASKLARDLYELGSVHDLRFEWSKALDAYRRAWTIENKYDYGFSYGVFAQKLNHSDEAIKVYQALLDLPDTPARRADTLNNLVLALSATRQFFEAEKAVRQVVAIRRELAKTDPQQIAEVAGAYNNLGLVLYQVQRNRGAEWAYLRALSIRCKLAATNPDANRPLVAETLVNLGLLYSRIQRIDKAEKVYKEALDNYDKTPADRSLVYKPEVAAALNNIGFLYKDAERPVDAEKAYEGALEKYKALAEANPEAYLPDVAMTLMNRANLYAKTERRVLAESDFDEAIRIYRGLHKPNRDPYLPGLAQTLTNVGSLYYRTLRAPLAMKAYRKSIAIYYRLTKASPEVYQSEYANVLNNLGNLYIDQGRMNDGQSSLDKSRRIYSRLAASDPDVFRPTLARVLNNLGRLYYRGGNLNAAANFSGQAETVLTPYWQKFPAVHNDQMSRILLLRTLIAETAGNPTDARDFALRALPLAYDSAVKGAVQEAIARLLPGGTAPG
jgi:tetratricopeptide (TPR) repeat protein